MFEHPEPSRLRWQQAVRNNSSRIIFDCLAGENGSNKKNMGRDTLFATTADTLEVPEASVWMTSSEFSADTKAVFPLQRGLMLRA